MIVDDKHMVYFISDLHLGHKSYRTLGNRNFDSIEDHDEYVIQCINETCTRKSDILWILGDLGLHCNKEQLVEKLKRITAQIMVIEGNHDKESTLKYLVKEKVIQTFYRDKILTLNNQQFHLYHFPLRTWWGFHHNVIHLYGHCHGTMSDHKRSMDVGIDNIGFHPISFIQIMEKFSGINNI